MEDWSDEPLGAFRIKFFLDTNILIDLVGKTYDGLNSAIKLLNDSNFIDLVSSKYVIFEFIDVRKKIMYQEEVQRVKSTAPKPSKSIAWLNGMKTLFRGRLISANNVNATLKYREDFEKKEVEFHSYKQTIKEKIEEELRVLIQDLSITYEENILHDGLLLPTREINLFTKISREDSLISISSVWPDELSSKERFLLFLTRDKAFVKSFNEIDLKSIFASHDLTPPNVEHVESMQLNQSYSLNLTDSTHTAQIPNYIPNKIKELITNKNQQYFIGKTIHPGNSSSFPIDVVCFKLLANKELKNDIYLTIIGKDLDFIYSVKLPVTEFWNVNPIVSYPFQNNTETDISFKPQDGTIEASTSLPPNIVSRLRETGNLVFINPDS